MIDKIVSHYRILEQLGGGGMGVVYRAEDIRLKRPVALKFLLPQLNLEEEAKQRFMQEAQAASALDHPNICTIYEVDQAEDGQMFIAMAYCEGETLQKKVTGNQLSVKRAIDIAMQISQGLGHAHKHGIVHRDIKPANMMITSDGLVKILDFGLAKLAGGTGLTKAGTMMGTPLYMSPEQITGGQVDHRSDIWSFGVLLHEMFAGRPPFSSEYQQAVFYAIVNQEPVPVTTINPAIPAPLERLIHRTLQKRATDRYNAMQEVLDELKLIKQRFDQNFDQRAADPGRTRTIAIPTDVLPKPAAPKPKLKLWIGAAVAALLLLAVAARFWPVKKDSPGSATASKVSKAAVNAPKDSVVAVQPAYTETQVSPEKARTQIQRPVAPKKETRLLGNLTVSSTPPGALIYLNANATPTTTPHTFSKLAIGTYQIRLALSGYVEENSAVEITANQTARVETNLNPLPPGSLAVSAIIAENGRERIAVAELFVDGQPLGQIPGMFKLTAGSHRIEAKIFGYVLESGERSVTIQNGQKTNLTLKFVKP